MWVYTQKLRIYSPLELDVVNRQPAFGCGVRTSMTIGPYAGYDKKKSSLYTNYLLINIFYSVIFLYF